MIEFVERPIGPQPAICRLSRTLLNVPPKAEEAGQWPAAAQWAAPREIPLQGEHP